MKMEANVCGDEVEVARRVNLCYVGGEWRRTSEQCEVADLYHGTPYSTTSVADSEAIQAALSMSRKGAAAMAAVPAHQRAKWLNSVADGLIRRQDEIAQMLVAEAGKPLTGARDEVVRSAETLRLSAIEAMKLSGEVVPMDSSLRARPGQLGLYVREPVGVVLAITPFNAPLNLLCHKVGPAIAAGNAVIAKPDARTPSTANLLWELFHEEGLPPGAITLLHGGADVGRHLVQAPEVDMISFTGGIAAAHVIRSIAGIKRVSLELGGNGANIVCADADLHKAAEQIAVNGFSYSGQSCISVQRVYVEDAVFDQFTALLLERVSTLVVGDPADPATDLGPMINQSTIERLLTWIQEAVREGGRLLAGGDSRQGILLPTVLADVPDRAKVVCEEVFGPIIVLQRVAGLDDALRHANESRFGMQAGIFTKSLETSMRAIRELKVGGVVVNGTSNYRLDQQPYGGVKHSGVGREGPAYAIAEMTDIKMIVLAH